MKKVRAILAETSEPKNSSAGAEGAIKKKKLKLVYRDFLNAIKNHQSAACSLIRHSPTKYPVSLSTFFFFVAPEKQTVEITKNTGLVIDK